MKVLNTIEQPARNDFSTPLLGSEIDQVSGGLAFLPLLGASAAGSFVGGYIAGKIWNAFQA